MPHDALNGAVAIPAVPGRGKEHIKKSAYPFAGLGKCGFLGPNHAMYAGNFAIPYDTLDIGLRLLSATLIGMGLGRERILRGKPTGIRTLGLVSFAAALVTLATMHATGIMKEADAFARVLQGALQGILVGVGFLGAGVIKHSPE